MKSSVKIRMFATITMLFVAVVGTYAQFTNAQVKTRPTYNYTPFNAANYDNSVTETATVGAQMPYYVERDADVNGSFFNPSTFIWNWPGTGAVSDIATSTAIIKDAETSSNHILVTMPTVEGTFELKTKEVSQPKFGVGCEGNQTTVTVTVVKKPEFSLTAGSVGACNTSVIAQNLTVTLTGTAPFYVDYEISAVGLDGTTVVGSTKTYNATLGAADKLLIDPTQLAHVADDAAPQSGKYTIKVTKVWDTNSWKAKNAADLAVVPTANTYDIYVYPAPTTQPIQHIKNL